MPLNGAFLFFSALCKQCESVKTELIKRIPNINCVLCDEDPDFFWKIHNVDLIPCVRYYDNGVMVFEKLYRWKSLIMLNFLNSVPNNYHGIYVFYSDKCRTCSDYLSSIKNKFTTIHAVNIDMFPDLYEILQINITPTTRVYFKDDLRISLEGMLFGIQYDKIREQLKGF